VPQGHKYESPQVCPALSDLFRVKGVPAGGENMSNQFLGDLKAARELHLQAHGFALTSLAGNEQVYPSVLCGYPNVELVPEVSIDVVPYKELTFVDGEYWFHLTGLGCARGERITYLANWTARKEAASL
jgi:hypothetical protein